MIASLNIVDNIFEDPEGVRDFALTHDFSKAPEFDGHTYPGFSPVKDARFLTFLAQRIATAIGSNVSVKSACMVCGTEEFSTQQWIHADNTCANFAGVIYLFDRPGYGTAFWNYFTSHSGLAALAASNHFGSPEHMALTMQEHGKSDAAWTKTDYADSVFNRLIFYPADRFHSRWPEQAFGDKPENCRLTISIFFNITE